MPAPSTDRPGGLDHSHMSNIIGGKVERYKAFISHQKSGSGATARWFQLSLAQIAGGRDLVFLDSDHLVSLDRLLETVRSRVDVLIVLVTDGIWWRPWCAGEIVAATEAGVPVKLVLVNEAKVDLAALPGKVRRSISEKDMETLEAYGIDYDTIETACPGLSISCNCNERSKICR